MDTEERGYKSYNYGFTLNQDGVIEEWLNSKAKTAREYKKIFYRNGDELDLSGLPVKSQELIRISLNKEALIVSLGAKLKVTKLKFIRDWFYNINFANFGNPYENVFLSALIPEGFAEKKSVQDKVTAYLSSFDLSIIGFHVEVMEGEDEEHRHVKIDAVHRMVGGVLFVDELNARLHPLLVRSFLITFLNPEINSKNAQLVFTTHDSWQLFNNLLRRDEIWFTEKNDSGVSVLYSLADFLIVLKNCISWNKEANFFAVGLTYRCLSHAGENTICHRIALTARGLCGKF